MNQIEAELRFAGDRADIARKCVEITTHLLALGLPDDYWNFIELGRAAKKNFAQRFSNALAQKIADALRPAFPGILPDEDGRGQETKARAIGGSKKLDVAYPLTGLGGLGLAVSIKTINFLDEKTGRYTKNVKRVDGELRAEAQDCHQRQPYAFLVAIILLPSDAATDGIDGVSSLKHAANVYRKRSRRRTVEDEHALFETAYLGLYESSGANFGRVVLFDVGDDVPDKGPPAATVSFAEVIKAIVKGFKARDDRA